LSEGVSALANEAGIAGYTRGVGPVLQPVFADHAVNDYRDFIRSSDSATYAEFWRGMVDSGVMFGPDHAGCWFVSGAHTEEDIAATLDVASGVMMTIASRANSRLPHSRA